MDRYQSIGDVIAAQSKAAQDARMAETRAVVDAKNAAFRAQGGQPLVQSSATQVEAGIANPGAVGAEATQVNAAPVVVETASGPAVVETKAARALKALAVDEEHGVIMVVGSLADAIDKDDDVLGAHLLVQRAHEFTAGKPTFKANHATDMPAQLVESVTGVPILASGRRLMAGEHIPDNDPMVSVGLIKGAGEATAWVAGVKPADKSVVADAKAGRVNGASWSALATRVKAD